MTTKNKKTKHFFALTIVHVEQRRWQITKVVIDRGNDIEQTGPTGRKSSLLKETEKKSNYW